MKLFAEIVPDKASLKKMKREVEGVKPKVGAKTPATPAPAPPAPATSTSSSIRGYGYGCFNNAYDENVSTTNDYCGWDWYTY